MSPAETRYVGLSAVGMALGVLAVMMPTVFAALAGYAAGSFVAFKVVTR